MRKFIYKTVIFILLLIITDITIGLLFDHLCKNAIGGNNYDYHYISDKCNEDILIYGSSRACHHYIPQILEDSFNLSSYNCGSDGNGIITMYGRYRMIKERHTPKIVIYDTSFRFDLFENDNTCYLNTLKCYCGNSTIDSIFGSVNIIERIKTKSKMYIHNSNISSVISNYLFSKIKGEKGYIPFYDTMDYEPKAPKTKKETLDLLKLQYFEKFIEENCRESKVFICISPIYYESDFHYYDKLIELCNKYDIKFLNHYNDTLFCGKKEYFKDTTHLNHKGATLYTQIIAKEIKELLSKEADCKQPNDSTAEVSI